MESITKGIICYYRCLTRRKLIAYAYDTLSMTVISNFIKTRLPAYLQYYAIPYVRCELVGVYVAIVFAKCLSFTLLAKFVFPDRDDAPKHSLFPTRFSSGLLVWLFWLVYRPEVKNHISIKKFRIYILKPFSFQVTRTNSRTLMLIYYNFYSAYSDSSYCDRFL